MKKSEALKCVLDCVISSEAFSLGYTPDEKFSILLHLTAIIRDIEKQEDLTK